MDSQLDTPASPDVRNRGRMRIHRFRTTHLAPLLEGAGGHRLLLGRQGADDRDGVVDVRPSRPQAGAGGRSRPPKTPELASSLVEARLPGPGVGRARP